MMDNNKIKELSSQIIETTSFSLNSKSIKQFSVELEKIDIRDFTIYNFMNNSGTWLRELVLSTFEHWKNLNFQDWRYIFDKIEGNDLAEYYMNPISKVYLGIDPKFKSNKGFRERIFKKKYQQTKKTPEFIEYSKSDFLGVCKDELERTFVNINLLIKYSDKLLKEMNKSYL